MHKSADAFVMVAMSHGSKDQTFLLADEKSISIDKELVTPFDGENWPIMINKPKIFLFQCCRGKGKVYFNFFN